MINDTRKSSKVLPTKRPFNEAGWAEYADKALGEDTNKPKKEYLESIVSSKLVHARR